MKKLNILMIIILAFSIGACTTATETQKDDKSPATADKKDETKNETAKADDTVKGADSPKAAIEAFVAGVKAKDEKAMKSNLSASTIKVFEAMAKSENKSLYEIIVAEDEEEMKSDPEMRNEKIDGENATLELKETKSDKWDTVNFVKENGGWKISLFKEKDVERMLDEIEKSKSADDADPKTKDTEKDN
jgi:hypothetical protein